LNFSLKCILHRRYCLAIGVFAMNSSHLSFLHLDFSVLFMMIFRFYSLTCWKNRL